MGENTGRYVPQVIPGITYRDTVVKSHDGDYVYPGRPIVEGDWPRKPEWCERPGTIWMANDAILVCAGCGLDCT